MTAHREVELKLLTDAQGAPALHSHALLSGAESRRVSQTSTYYDTASGAVRSAGFTLRLRSADGRCIQTVKQDSGDAAGMFDRPEWEEEVAGPNVDLDAVDRTPLGAVLGPKKRRKLQPIVTSKVERTIWLLSHSGSELELSLDEGMIAAGGAEQPLNELELELRRGDPAAIIELAREIGRSVPLKMGVLSKAERGFALADGTLGTVTKAAPVRIEPAMSTGESFAAIAHSCLKHFWLNEPLVAEHRQHDALHQARVAMRRLRSAISLFRPALQDKDFDRLRQELRWFTEQLGHARNLDVFLQRFDGELSASARAAIETARAEAYDAVITALESQRFRDLMLDLVGWIELGDWRNSEAANSNILQFALPHIDRRWRKIRKGAEKLKLLDEEARHRVRIDIKKLRYTLEFLSSLFEPKRHKDFLKPLEKVQEELGHLNDMATARELVANIPGVAESIPDPPPDDERKHLAKAQRAYAKVAEAGPFWRDAAQPSAVQS